MRRSFSAVKVEIEREIGMDEVRRQLHNEAIMEEMRALESDVGKIGGDLNNSLDADPSKTDETEIVNEPHPDDSGLDHSEENDSEKENMDSESTKP